MVTKMGRTTINFESVPWNNMDVLRASLIVVSFVLGYFLLSWLLMHTFDSPEFAIHPDSLYVQNNNLDLNKEIVLFCAAGGRSALAAKTLKEMGFKKVSHVEGGFGKMSNSGFKVIK